MKIRAVILLAIFVGFPMLDSWAVDTVSTQAQRVTTDAAQPNPSEEVISQASRFHPRQWGLNETQWQRYLSLMQGIRGSISQPNLSPLEVLGIHADTDSERQEYAERLAKMMREDTERVLAFAKAYAYASKKLNANTALIDSTLLGLGSSSQLKPIQAGDRLLFFTRLSHCPACKRQLNQLLNALKQQAVPLNIYITDATSDQAIQDWAKNQPFAPEDLTQKLLTLNHDHGTLTRLLGVTGTVPKILRVRGHTFTAVDPVSLN